MQKNFEFLVEILQKIEGLSIIDSNFEDAWIHFKLATESVLALITAQITELKEQYPCSLLVFNSQNDPEDLSYQIIIEAEDKESAIKALIKKISYLLEADGDARKAKNQEMGLPDLSLVTLRQMALELKQRQNLTFALVWIEASNKDNIAIEGNGEKTQIVGLLARGLNMAVQWADKDIRFHRPKDDE